MLQRWLRVPFTDAAFFCPYCDGMCDVYGDHAACCSGGGDRTKRHNAVRDQGFRAAVRAGLCPEREKPGLLHPRPMVGARHEDGVALDGASNAAARRPADVFLPRWLSGGPAALDFAITSGLRGDVLARTADDGSSATTAYEHVKRTYLDTASHCREEGLEFVPMVADALGGWGPSAQKAWHTLARSLAQTTGEPLSTALEQLYQQLSIVVHREGARAILRRLPGAGAGATGPAEAAAALLSAGAVEGDD